VPYAYLASVPSVVSKPSLGDFLESALNHVPLQSVLPQLETVPLAKVLNSQLFWQQPDVLPLSLLVLVY
jgi:hypothetical protein